MILAAEAADMRVSSSPVHSFQPANDAAPPKDAASSKGAAPPKDAALHKGAALPNDAASPKDAAAVRPAALGFGAESLVRGAGTRGVNGAATSPSDRSSPAAQLNSAPTNAPVADELSPSPLEVLGGGLKSIGSAIADFFSFTGSAISKVVEAVFVTNAIIETVSSAGSRLGDAARGLWTGTRDAVVGFYKNTAEALGTLGRGVARVAQGDWGGFGDVGRGALKLLQSPIDATLMVGGRVLSAVQTLTGLEPVGRELGIEEKETLYKVFGNSIDLDAVRLKEGAAGAFSPTSRPFAHGNTIYMQDTKSMAALVHEMTHVWQHQNGGTDYMSEALVPQLTLGTAVAYDWRAGVSGNSWDELNPEQQSAFIESAFQAGAFEQEPPAFPAGSYLPEGMTLAELNGYLRHAVTELRSGRGAP